MAYSAPLKRHLDHFDAIPEDAKAALSGMFDAPREVAKGEVLRRADGPARGFWVVAKGWFVDSSEVAGGGRQNYSVYQEGDVMGLQDLGWDTAVCDTIAVTKGSILQADKAEFRALLAEHPVLAAFFLTYGIYDYTRVIDRLRVVGRMEAVKRVAHFLLQCWSDQNEPDELPSSGAFTMPLDQTTIGDCIGLTNISVSRMLTELEQRGLLIRAGRLFNVPNTAALKELADFTERRRSIPVSWILEATSKNSLAA